MRAISSPHNPGLQSLRRLHRTRERARTGLFVAEGEDLVRAAHLAGRTAVAGFCTPGADLVDVVFQEVEPDVLAMASTLGSGTRAVGVYEQSWGAPTGPLCVYLHGVGDPGNIGTVLRGALAFGACSVALGPRCADPHSPKAVRASMGAIFAVRLARVADVSELPGERIALLPDRGEPIWGVAERSVGGPAGAGFAGGDGRPPLTLLVGAEREGLPEEVVAACGHVAHIPIASESLNAAMAATVALYEMTRPSSRVTTT